MGILGRGRRQDQLRIGGHVNLAGRSPAVDERDAPDFAVILARDEDIQMRGQAVLAMGIANVILGKGGFVICRGERLLICLVRQ
jgi:hypothetical protein